MFFSCARSELIKTLSVINQLQKNLFLIYIARDYPEKHYFYEKILQTLLTRIFRRTKKLRHQKASKHIDHLLEIVIALGNLRYRIKDIATFEMCEKEFRDISASLSVALDTLNSAELSKLLNHIQAFEDIVHHTLQVVSHEPLDFLIFIQNLYALHDELCLLDNDISYEKNN